MIRRLAAVLSGTQLSERLALAGFVGVAAPVAIAGLVVQPLVDARTAAFARNAEARATLAWVQVQDAAFRATGTEAAGAAPSGFPAPAALADVERSLETHGLRGAVRRLEQAGGNAVDLSLASVPLVQLGPFLDDLGPALGYAVATMHIEAEGGEGLVSVDLALAPHPGAAR